MLGQHRDLARVLAILEAPEANGREHLALHLALQTDIPAGEAIERLQISAAAMPDYLPTRLSREEHDRLVRQAFADGYERYCSIVRAGYVFGQPRLAEHLAGATDLGIEQSVRIIMAAAEDRSAPSVVAAMAERHSVTRFQ